MNINPEQEQFQQLRRLLALKRHEQPPPGYFDSFSREVIVRIRVAQSARSSSIFESLSWEAPWVQQLLGSLQHRPILAGGFGFAVCALLLGGLAFSGNSDLSPDLSGSPIATAVAPQLQFHGGLSAAPIPYRPAAPAEPAADVVAVGQPNDSLFQQLRELPAPCRALFISSPAPGTLQR
jgi:hypothetical protein